MKFIKIKNEIVNIDFINRIKKDRCSISSAKYKKSVDYYILEIFFNGEYSRWENEEKENRQSYFYNSEEERDKEFERISKILSGIEESNPIMLSEDSDIINKFEELIDEIFEQFEMNYLKITLKSGTYLYNALAHKQTGLSTPHGEAIIELLDEKDSE